ncbi:MAG: hypothetical protein ACRDA4_02195 [Filifactoraceae bacterium]
MKLDFFTLIDDTIELHQDRRASYEQASIDITEILRSLLDKYDDDILTIKTRIKTGDSLREKMIRKKLYKESDTAFDVLDKLPDPIGVMLSCRFIDEEEDIYNIIKELFTVKTEDGFYVSPETTEDFRLDMDSVQPQKQKNGINIYRIDGYYYYEGKLKFNFELQIKSLVHGFWAEIEHEIVYKNNNYMLVGGFVKDFLGTIHQSLEGVDRQLRILSCQIKSTNSTGTIKESFATDNMYKVLAKSINDIFINQMSNNMGFNIDFKKTCDILSQYLLDKYYVTGGEMQTSSMLGVLTKIKYAAKTAINFEEPITLEGSFISDDEFCQILGNSFIALYNTDFEWNVFFKILFNLEPGNNLMDFTEFVEMLKSKFGNNSIYVDVFKTFGQDKAFLIKDDMLRTTALAVTHIPSIDIIFNENINGVIGILSKHAKTIAGTYTDYQDYVAHMDKVLRSLQRDVVEYFD